MDHRTRTPLNFTSPTERNGRQTSPVRASVRTFSLLLLLVLPGIPTSNGATFVPVASFRDRLKVVERVRQRSFLQPVEQKTITRAELRSFIRQQFDKDLGVSTQEYLNILEAAHLISPAGTNFEKLLDLYDAQVLAFYDPETHTYYSLDRPPEGTSLNPMMADTVAIHELMHAMQDQRFLVGEGLARQKGRWDAQTAYQAVVEGEATLVMMAAMFELMGKSLNDLIEDESVLQSLSTAASAESGFVAGTEPYFIESMKFPYVDGLRFVVEAYKRGGWTAVDELHRDPPRSTEQILHPELYFGEGRNVDLSEPVLIEPLELSEKPIFHGPFGEFAIRFLLGDEAAAGWRGDDVAFYGTGSKKLVVMQSEWDTNRDAEEFSVSYRAFLHSKGHKDVVMTCKGSSVRTIYGGSKSMRRKLGVGQAPIRYGKK